jgi:hypothetical protein
LPSTDFTADELKLLLVAVRQMRRTFAAACKRVPLSVGSAADSAKGAPPLDAYEALYEELFQKLRRLAGPIPEAIEEALE